MSAFDPKRTLHSEFAVMHNAALSVVIVKSERHKSIFSPGVAVND